MINLLFFQLQISDQTQNKVASQVKLGNKICGTRSNFRLALAQSDYVANYLHMRPAFFEIKLDRFSLDQGVTIFKFKGKSFEFALKFRV